MSGAGTVAGAPDHRPVLLAQTVTALSIKPDGVYVDGTFGRGGHAAAIVAALGARGGLLVFDKDPQAIAQARRYFRDDVRVHIVEGSFTMLGEVLQAKRWVRRVDGAVFDLGVSSPQLDDAERGFSFQADGPLDMRMNPRCGESAADFVNRAGEHELAGVLRTYGEERFARRIARAIVAARQRAPLLRTMALAEVVSTAVPRREPGKHPATRVFQAIRIHVNRELHDLDSVLDQLPEALAPGGRVAVISFHSLEDRRVKHYFRHQAQGRQPPKGVPVRADQIPRPVFRTVGKPVFAGAEELARNPRARSAVLRVAERVV